MKTRSYVCFILMAVLILPGFGTGRSRAESGQTAVVPLNSATSAERVSLNSLVGEMLEKNPEILAFERRVEAALEGRDPGSIN